MARPSSKIMQTPAEKKAAVGNLMTSLKLAREPFDIAQNELKAARAALSALEKTHTDELNAAAKTAGALVRTRAAEDKVAEKAAAASLKARAAATKPLFKTIEAAQKKVAKLETAMAVGKAKIDGQIAALNAEPAPKATLSAAGAAGAITA